MARVDLKVVLLGKEFSGKTSLVERFLNDRFAGENRYQNTIGAAYGAKMVMVEERSGRFCWILWAYQPIARLIDF